MEFRNLTPFQALCFSALDVDDREHRVIAMKVGYRLVSTNGTDFDAVAIDNDPVPLCMADEYDGEVGESNVREESDLAPYKPRCDVVLRGAAHAPEGLRLQSWDVRIRVSEPLPEAPLSVDEPYPLSPGMALNARQRAELEQAQADAARRRAEAPRFRPLLDKTLRVTGPRHFRRDALTLWRGWRLLEPEPASTVAMTWANAFGGRSIVRNPERLRAQDEPEFLLNEVCFSNPLGRGWVDHRYLRLVRKTGQDLPRAIPAPQIEAPDAPIRQLRFCKNPQGDSTAAQMARSAGTYGASPAGMGIVGRAWAPRLALAGTYDAAWLEKRWPYLPKDFDFGYWNCAAVDQQVPYPSPHARVELWNLTDPEVTPRGYLSASLPGHRPFVLLRFENGHMLPFRMVLDTLIVDTERMMLICTYRIRIAADAPIRVAELRYEADPTAPLVRGPAQTGPAAALSHPEVV
ncbi:DUF2169 family type VI secretion system accessory protein [Burkholderia cenocepacia]|uniref:DUF2169 domain-containing protein n=1 Tax=Burkholderia cenocepacia TaxID=95486 RepID=A0A6B2MF75_9BURK|nr:DUF2169 domain-containing protein [Burkholderia cenocepacia]NDV73509.1 DUF2169 domain-containing protein [Burkholderia cenocepacia]